MSKELNLQFTLTVDEYWALAAAMGATAMYGLAVPDWLADSSETHLQVKWDELVPGLLQKEYLRSDGNVLALDERLQALLAVCAHALSISTLQLTVDGILLPPRHFFQYEQCIVQRTLDTSNALVFIPYATPLDAFEAIAHACQPMMQDMPSSPQLPIALTPAQYTTFMNALTADQCDLARDVITELSETYADEITRAFHSRKRFCSWAVTTVDDAGESSQQVSLFCYGTHTAWGIEVVDDAACAIRLTGMTAYETLGSIQGVLRAILQSHEAVVEAAS